MDILTYNEAQQLTGKVPLGTITELIGPPTSGNFLPADGTNIAKSEYQALAAAYPNAQGPGGFEIAWTHPPINEKSDPWTLVWSATDIALGTYNAAQVLVLIASNGTIFRSDDLGITLSDPISIPCCSTGGAVEYGNGIFMIYGTADSEDGLQKIGRSLDGGYTWTEHVIGNGSEFVPSFIVYAGNNTWVGTEGNTSQVAISTDNGQTWAVSTKAQIPSGATWSHNSLASDQNGTIMGSKYTSFSGGSVLIRSTDYGVTWAQVAPSYHSYIVSYAHGKWFRNNSPGDVPAYWDYSTDVGENWTPISPITSGRSSMCGVAHDGNETFIFLGQYNMDVSFDNMATLVGINVVPPAYDIFAGFIHVEDDIYIGYGNYYGIFYSLIRISKSAGPYITLPDEPGMYVLVK